MFTLAEYQARLAKLHKLIQTHQLDYLAIFDAVNITYYTGTAQTGVLIIPADENPAFFVRRNLDRARLESWLTTIQPMQSYKDVVSYLEENIISSQRIGLAMAQITLANFNLFKKYLPLTTTFIEMTSELNYARAVKSDAELAVMREAGHRQQQVFDQISSLLNEGITEWQLATELRARMMAQGDAGVTRVSGSGGILGGGNVSFGDSANYPTTFDGPGGTVGLCSILPITGSGKSLERHQPIYIDFVFSHQGYFVDRTRIFSLGKLSDHIVQAHQDCLDIQQQVVSRLRPGAIPSQIYAEVLTYVEQKGISEGLMGLGANQVRFFGHGIGLVVDEYPVIAKKFDLPLQAGMVIAVEPKKGIPGIGMVGIENTWLITDSGAEKLTPGDDDIVVVC